MALSRPSVVWHRFCFDLLLLIYLFYLVLGLLLLLLCSFCLIWFLVPCSATPMFIYRFLWLLTRYLFYCLKGSVWLASVLFWLFSFPGAFPFSDHYFVLGFLLRPDVSVIWDQEYSLMELSRFKQSSYHSGFRKGYF